MNDEDIAALNWLNGEVKGGVIEAVQHDEPLSVEGSIGQGGKSRRN